MTNTRFMCGVISELWKHEVTSFDPRDVELHAAFAAAAKEVGEERLSTMDVEFYIDPITGTLADIFSVASVLQGYGLLQPSAVLTVLNESR